MIIQSWLQRFLSLDCPVRQLRRRGSCAELFRSLQCCIQGVHVGDIPISLTAAEVIGGKSQVIWQPDNRVMSHISHPYSKKPFPPYYRFLDFKLTADLIHQLSHSSVKFPSYYLLDTRILHHVKLEPQALFLITSVLSNLGLSP
jgi:hypothetical protein